MLPKLSFPLRRGVLHVHVSVSFAKYGTLTALTIFGHKRGRSTQGFCSRRQEFLQCLACPLCVMIYSPQLWIYVDIVFGQLHLFLGTEPEAVPADTVSFELCIYSYLRASCVRSDPVCRLYSFIINVLLLLECRWSHLLQILEHICNTSFGLSILLARLRAIQFNLK